MIVRKLAMAKNQVTGSPPLFNNPFLIISLYISVNFDGTFFMYEGGKSKIRDVLKP
jgi:hypothetical protein